MKRVNANNPASPPGAGKILLVVGGPTASGKTQLAIDLAIHFNTEIISADARQFYRELSIGTAKPSADELSKVRHHLINSHSVSEHVNASGFAAVVLPLLERLFAKHDVVIMAGGSGLFIDAVINGLDPVPDISPEKRMELEKMLEEKGMASLQDLLKEKDPETYQRIDLHNPRRLIRALEVCLQTGRPYSEFLGKKKQPLPWTVIMAGIEHPREVLYERINQRTQQMIRQGLKEEALSVIQYRKNPALQTVGYREMFDHIDGKISLDEAESLIAQHTRNYAKRQLTWFRKYPGMIRIKPEEIGKLVRMIEEKLSGQKD